MSDNVKTEVFATDEGIRLIDAEGDHGPSNLMEVYCDESRKNEITISTAEREEFEGDEEVRLEADVIPNEDMQKLLLWCCAAEIGLVKLSDEGWINETADGLNAVVKKP